MAEFSDFKAETYYQKAVFCRQLKVGLALGLGA
jgi:hypothetical protein